MNRRRPCITAFSLLLFICAAAQNNRAVNEKCGTMAFIEKKLQQHAALRERFEQKKVAFNRTVSTRSQNSTARLTAVVYIPIVFHIVMSNPGQVTDAQIQAQLDTLNKSFFGVNGDTSKIPSWFKPLLGRSGIQFCLAQRTPDGEATTGIERIVTTRSAFNLDDAVKRSWSGGADSWNTARYFNVWVCPLSTSLLGYGTFPDDPTTVAAEQGVVIDYRSLPGGSSVNFNSGKTLAHETGHYFNLYHIWGDDNGGCSGDDFVGDTPNQADATSGCPSGIKNDNCTQGGFGIMYQNYMDYSNDNCLVMFTQQQVDRMETALSTFRSGLLSSNGCQPVILNNYDVQLRSVNEPPQRLCEADFTPQVTIKNRGAQSLTSLQISTSVDNAPATIYQWTGSVTTYNSINISLGNFTVTPGTHTLTVYISNPNSNTDQDRSNDTLQVSFQYLTPVNSVSEGFESTTFPPTGWDIINRDNALTWERVTGIAKTGNASIRMNNFDYDRVGEVDELRMPSIKIPAGSDSAFLSFQVAAATYSDFAAANNWDTLEVLISDDCGSTYTSVYRKWGEALISTKLPVAGEFFPSASQWRKDSINLAGFIGLNDLLITFRNTTGFENNIYLDDINLRTVVVNPNLKTRGFLITPNPTSGSIAVQFYPQPSNLKAIQLYNSTGQKIEEVIITNNQANSYYSFDLSRYAKGMYVVRAVFTDQVITTKVIRL